MLIVTKLTKRQEAGLKAFCRLIDASIGEFTKQALHEQISRTIASWDECRLDSYKRLSNTFSRSKQKNK